MKRFNKVTSIALATSILLSSSMALAKDYDLKIKETNDVKSDVEWLFDQALFTDVMFDETGKYLIEAGGKFYKMEEVLAATAQNPNAKLTDIVKNLTPVDAPVESELKVVEISAINATGKKVALDGATVARNSTYEISFDGEFNPETITNTTIKLLKGTETMAISQPTTDKNVVSFRSLSTLEAGAEYKLVIDGIKSKDGKTTITNKTVATFKAEESVVTKKVTANGTKVFDATTNEGVSLNVSGNWNYGTGGSVIQVEFDTPVDKSTINSSTVQLVDVATGKNLAVEGNQLPNTNYLNVQVVGSGDFLVPKHQYKLVLSGLKAANGKAIDDFSVTFAYQADKPVVIGNADIYNGDLKIIANTVDGLVNPLTTARMLDNGTTFKAAAALTVDFGAAEVKLDESTVTTDYLYIREKDTKEKVAQTISYNKEMNRVTLTPTERLKDDTDYEIFQSPYMKNVFGVTLGDKDSDYKTVDFKTLDVTAPTVVGQPESTLESKALNNLPLDKEFKIRVKMSERIGDVTLVNSADADAYTKFATASISGNVLVTRADDEKITSEAIQTGFITSAKPVIGTDQYIELTINPVVAGIDEDDIKGKTFRVTLAGTNPMRKNTINKVITDDYTIMRNALANDYSFTFSFEGEDKTAPKVTDVKGSYNGTDLAGSLQGMTNVNQGKMRIYFDSKDVNEATISEIKLVDKNNTEHDAVLDAAGVVKTGSTSYADVSFSGAAEGAAEGADEGAARLKIQDVEDMAGNKSTLQTYDLTLGNGPKVTGSTLVKVSNHNDDNPASDEAVVKLTINTASLDKTTLAGNVKLFDGETEVATTIDSTNDGYILLIPTTPLKGNTEYTVKVAKEVKNVDGNLLQQDISKAPTDYSIKLKTKLDSAPVMKEQKLDEAKKTLTVKFDQEVKSPEITIVSAGGATILESKSGKYVDAKVNKTDVVFELGKLLVSTDTLDAGTTYIVTVVAEGLDGNGNGTGKTANEVFNIIPSTQIKADAVAPEVDETNITVNPLTIDASGVITVEFNEAVKLLDESAFKVISKADGKEIELIAGYSVNPVDELSNYVVYYKDADGNILTQGYDELAIAKAAIKADGDNEGGTITAKKFTVKLPIDVSSGNKFIVTVKASKVSTPVDSSNKYKVLENDYIDELTVTP